MDIVVNSKGARTAAVILLLALAGLMGWSAWQQGLIPNPESEPALPPDALAAAKGVSAFYTLDFTEPPNLWPQRVCAYTTQEGCKAIQDFFAPAVIASAERYQVRTQAMAEPLQVVADLGTRRIWKLAVTLTNPWSDETVGAQEVYAEVRQEGGQWLLERILFEQEIAQYLTPAP